MVSPDIRIVAEGTQYQGEDEKIYYCLNIEAWGSNPTDVSLVVKDSSGADVTTAVTDGVPIHVSDSTHIILTRILNLEPDEEYRAEVKFTCSSNVFEAIIPIMGQV